MSSAPRRAEARVLVIGLLAVFTSAWVIRVAIDRAGPINLENVSVGRTNDLLAALPTIVATPGPTVLVVGSSNALFGFSPPLLDAWASGRGKRITSFNLGNVMTHVHFHWLYMRELKRALEQAHRRASVIVLEFTPFQMTKATAANPAFREDPLVSAFYSTEAFSGELWGSRDAAIRHLVNRFVFDRIDPATWGAQWFSAHTEGTIVDDDPPWWFGKPVERTPDVALIKLRFDGAKSHRWRPNHWNPDERGGPKMLVPETEVAYRRYLDYQQSNEGWQQGYTFLRECCGLDMDFDDSLLEDFMKMCDLSRTVADHTYVLVSPIRPKLASLLPPGALDRERAALERVTSRCGVPAIPLTGFTDEDFMDPVHPNELSGVPKYTRGIAELIEPSL
jgi:hypothetical protein